MRKLRVFLVRHGETEANSKGLLQGHLDTPLTDLGKQQAEALGRRLENQSFCRSYTSDLLRAKATAKLILGNREVPCEHTTLLRERSWGIYEGRPNTEFHDAREAFTQANPGQSFLPPGGESGAQVAIRVREFISMLKATPDLENVLVVAHGGLNRCFLSIVLGKPEHGPESVPQQNACLNELVFNIPEAEPMSVHAPVLNCIQHLEACGARPW
jgi:broad specificity phosphatase PhoE